MTERTQAIKVLIVDDHPVVRLGLRTMLESEHNISVTGLAASAKEAMAEVQRLQPDVVLTDLRMPEVEGVEAIVELRRIHANLRILVLTNHQEDEYIFRAFQAGAMGYLLKSTPQEEIVQAVEMVHQNKRYVPPNSAERLLKTITREELPKEIRSKALRGRISSSTIKAGSNRSRSLRRNLRMSCLPGRPLSPRRKRPRSALLHWEGL